VSEVAANEYDAVIVIHKGRRKLRLYRCDMGSWIVVKSYRVGVGRRDCITPSGRFAIQAMLEDPVWHVPDNPRRFGSLAGRVIPAESPENAIAARWIGFHGAIGIHGKRGRFGLGSSNGCVRMSVADVVDLFARVRLHTPVVVI